MTSRCRWRAHRLRPPSKGSSRSCPPRIAPPCIASPPRTTLAPLVGLPSIPPDPIPSHRIASAFLPACGPIRRQPGRGLAHFIISYFSLRAATSSLTAAVSSQAPVLSFPVQVCAAVSLSLSLAVRPPSLLLPVSHLQEIQPLDGRGR